MPDPHLLNYLGCIAFAKRILCGFYWNVVYGLWFGHFIYIRINVLSPGTT